MPLTRTLKASQVDLTAASYSAIHFYPLDEILQEGITYLTISDGGLGTLPRLSRRQYNEQCGDDIDFLRCLGQHLTINDYPLTQDYLFLDSQHYQNLYGLAHRVEHLLRVCAPDYVIVQQGGEPLSKIILAKCMKLGIPALLWETPFFRGKILVDSVGMHFFPGENQIDRDWPLRSSTPLTREQRDRLDRFIASWKEERESKYRQTTDPEEMRELDAFCAGGKKILFFPGQHPFDANVVNGLSPFTSYDDKLAHIRISLPDDWVIIHKKHPKSPFDIPSGRLAHNFLVVKNVSIHDLIARADAVLTLSSNVGMEAFIYDKPVICFGTPHYAGKGFTLELTPDKNLGELLEAAGRFTPDPELKARFLHYIVFEYLIDEGDGPALLNRLVDATGDPKTDPRAPYAGNYPQRLDAYLRLIRQYDPLALQNFSHVEILDRLRSTCERGFAGGLEEAYRQACAETPPELEHLINAYPASVPRYQHLYYGFAMQLLASSRSILDFGCGGGYGSWILAHNEDVHVTGVDACRQWIEFASNRCVRDNITFVHASAGSWEAPEAGHDAVCAFGAVEQAANPEGLLARFWRALRPGGLLLFSVPYLGYYPLRNEEAHIEHYTARTLGDLLSTLDGVNARFLLGLREQMGRLTLHNSITGPYLLAILQKGGGEAASPDLQAALDSLLPFREPLVLEAAAEATIDNDGLQPAMDIANGISPEGNVHPALALEENGALPAYPEPPAPGGAFRLVPKAIRLFRQQGWRGVTIRMATKVIERLQR